MLIDHLLTCDHLAVKGSGKTEALAPISSRARIEMVAPSHVTQVPGSLVASADNLLTVLRNLNRGAPGLAFFRCHATLSIDDPAASHITLSDGSFPFGILSAVDKRSGEPIFGLPATAVLACCSSSGLRARGGGEVLGFAAIALAAGAQRVLAATADIPQNDFTTSLDDRLVELARQPGDHAELLRKVQVEALAAWKAYPAPTHEPADYPSPLIWGYYQAFGV